MPGNKEINRRDGWYKNVCCGLEVYISAGKAFPDCAHHKNLPTIWKPSDEQTGSPANPEKKQGGGHAA